MMKIVKEKKKRRKKKKRKRMNNLAMIPTWNHLIKKIIISLTQLKILLQTDLK
jgi:hexokinase